MKKILLTGMMVCLTASTALAAGLNINWVTNVLGNCSAVATSNITWDCTIDNPADPNLGDFNFVVSFVPATALIGFNAFEVVIDAQSDAPLSAWWQYYNPGSCRAAGFAAELPPSLPAAPCLGSATTRLYQTAAYGGMGLWLISPANRMRTIIGYATAATRTVPLITTTQYNAMHMHVNTGQSLGVIADPDNGIEPVVECAGCTQPVTLVLQQIGIYGKAGVAPNQTPTAETITTVAGAPLVGAQQSIKWQGGGTYPPIPVSSRNTTWGQVKSLYR
jgi:hypothetical protein